MPNQEPSDRAGQQALALLKLLLIDGAIPRCYRRAAVELLTLHAQASGLPLELPEEPEPLPDRSRPAPRPEPTGFMPEAAYFQDVKLRSGRGLSDEVCERIEQLLLVMNNRGPVQVRDLCSALRLSPPRVIHAIMQGGSAFVRTSYGVYAATRASELWIQENGKVPLVHQARSA